jgi:hypothetical protein
MINEKQILPFIEKQIELSESQGAAIRVMFEGMQQIQVDVSVKFDEVKGMVQEVRDSVTLTDFESYTLREAVKSKAGELTKDRYKEGDEKFSSIFGKHLRLIYSKLKKKFEVAKYSHIRRYDFHSAVEFVNSFVMEDYI